MSLSGKAKGASVRGKINLFAIDKTLTIAGAAADAKAVGDALGLNENSTFIQGGEIRYFRIVDGKLEWSFDGLTWNVVNIGGSAGDIIIEGDIVESTTVIKSEDVKYFRINQLGQLEWSEDGKTWRVVNIGGSAYSLPAASATTLGGVKIGAGLTIDENGVLSATGGGDLPNGDEVSY